MSLKAILFDMDGTLTVPWIDWTELRTAIGATDGLGIIEFIGTLPPDSQEKAEATVREFEMDAARQAPANPGLDAMFEQLDQLSLKRALITNNHRAAMLHVVERYGLSFDLCLSREDALLKPAPDLLLLALEHFCISPEEAVFVGDGRYDRVASAAAGVRYVHLSHDRTIPEQEETFYHLAQLLDLLDVSG
ncbi:MAG: HAD family hydrolase [Gemmatimonadetes bacterium]|nr:HAD family hydrolase [Gemmatimonadota bacterium]MBT5054985.1 HAD family hydrolase [Gemmatimonadota bacterium]MBT5145054.1 HAD family hydrolase [Gemmatimonadota bacterium]MBT5592097.1 HAD family hydrolase [Gemmatimonadota bacterium]MBT5964154.1 HAD family hydrolase [Gemmatimonadota bacterium]